MLYMQYYICMLDYIHITLYKHRTLSYLILKVNSLVPGAGVHCPSSTLQEPTATTHSGGS